MGRLTAVHLCSGQHQLSREHETECGLRESLQVQCEGMSSRVRYERLSASESATFEFTDSVTVSIQKQPAGGHPGMIIGLTQAPSGELLLKFADGKREGRIEAPSFWHLLLAERSLCERELVPLLLLLRPTWDFNDATDRIERNLLRAAHSGQVVPRARLAELVAELAHHDFHRRQAADRELRALGPTVLVYLSSLDATQLTCEQRQRVRRIQHCLSNASADTPERVALWLVGDERIWITLLSHSDAVKRHLALLQLMEMRPDLTSFDPYGDELYRQKQLAQMRLVLTGR